MKTEKQSQDCQTLRKIISTLYENICGELEEADQILYVARKAETICKSLTSNSKISMNSELAELRQLIIEKSLQVKELEMLLDEIDQLKGPSDLTNCSENPT